jgi:hypothetical protein
MLFATDLSIIPHAPLITEIYCPAESASTLRTCLRKGFPSSLRQSGATPRQDLGNTLRCRLTRGGPLYFLPLARILRETRQSRRLSTIQIEFGDLSVACIVGR